jgi:hypothetical protein
MMKIPHLILVAVASALIAAPASASTWLVNYVSDNGSPTTANLTLTVDDTANALGTYNVLGISGDVDGDVVTGLATNPSSPNFATSSDGLFWFDNTFQAPAPSVSWYGLLFSSATHEYNLFSDSPTQFELYKSDYHSYVSSSVGTLSVTPNLAVTFADHQTGGVPEPSSWALMLAGFGALGAALRAKRRRYAQT